MAKRTIFIVEDDSRVRFQPVIKVNPVEVRGHLGFDEGRLEQSPLAQRPDDHVGWIRQVQFSPFSVYLVDSNDHAVVVQ